MECARTPEEGASDTNALVTETTNSNQQVTGQNLTRKHAPETRQENGNVKIIIPAHAVQTRATSRLTSVSDTRGGTPDSDGDDNSISAENEDSQDWWRHLANVDISENETESDTQVKSDFASAQRADKSLASLWLRAERAAMNGL